MGLSGVWWGFGRSVDSVWKVGIWCVSRWSLAGFLRVSWRCLERGLGRVPKVFGIGLGGV